MSAADGSRGRTAALVIGSLVLVAASVAVRAYVSSSVSTDDAYVQIARIAVNSNVSGQVVEVAVADNQHVRRGDVLLRLDDRQLRQSVAQARARLDAAKAEIAVAKAAYLQKQAELEAANGRLEHADRYLMRESRVASALSVQRLENVRQAAAEAHAAVESLRHQVAGFLAKLGGNVDGRVEQYPSIRLARADLEQAEMSLSFATVLAPFDGFVARTENVRIGSYVTATKPIFELFSDRDVWVEANFKEDQLARIRVGQSAEVNIDKFSDRIFSAEVVSINPGTGASFAVLPPENATGNWVKVVQRVPVKLKFLEPPPVSSISSGLSAVVTIKKRSE